MGNRTTFPIQGRTDFEKWNADDVKAASAKWQSLRQSRRLVVPGPKDRRDSPCYYDNTVNRRTFFELFDMASASSNGKQYLSLLERFDDFAAGQDHAQVYEVFGVLCLFCNAFMSTQVELLFMVFSSITPGGMRALHVKDMELLIVSVVCSMYRLGGLPSCPQDKQFTRISEEMFFIADADVDGYVGQHEFQTWANTQFKTRQVLHKLLPSLGYLVHSVPSMSSMPKPKLAITVDTEPANTAARLTEVVELAVFHHKVQQASDNLKSMLGGQRDERSKGFEKWTALASGVPLDSEQAGTFISEKLKIMQRHTRTMKLRAVIGKRSMGRLVATTKFTKNEIVQIANEFIELSEANAELAYDTFCAIMIEHVPALAEDPIHLLRLFKYLDTDQSGSLCFSELVCGMSMLLRGELKEKLSLLFHMYDNEGKGQIPVSELIHVVKTSNPALAKIVDVAEQIATVLDINGDQEVSCEEFISSLNSNPKLYDAFANCVSVSVAMASAIRTLHRQNADFDFDHLKAIPAKYFGRSREMTAKINRQAFHQFMFENFDCTPDIEPYVDSVFDAFDANHHGYIVLRNVMNGFAQLLARNTTEQARFYFAVYDLDGSGTLDQNEIVHLMLSSQMTTDENAAAIINTLAAIDERGVGWVDHDEFLVRAVRAPLILNTMEKLLAVTFHVTRHPYKFLQPKSYTIATSKDPAEYGMELEEGTWSARVTPKPSPKASPAGGPDDPVRALQFPMTPDRLGSEAETRSGTSIAMMLAEEGEENPAQAMAVASSRPAAKQHHHHRATNPTGSAGSSTSFMLPSVTLEGGNAPIVGSLAQVSGSSNNMSRRRLHRVPTGMSSSRSVTTLRGANAVPTLAPSPSMRSLGDDATPTGGSKLPSVASNASIRDLLTGMKTTKTSARERFGFSTETNTAAAARAQARAALAAPAMPAAVMPSRSQRKGLGPTLASADRSQLLQELRDITQLTRPT